MLVRGGETFAEECGLAGPRQTDQDYALHVCVIAG
jgi:hypothetical protein